MATTPRWMWQSPNPAVTSPPPASISGPAGSASRRTSSSAPIATIRQRIGDLIAVAEEENAEFIVIGLRRRTPVGKLILGWNAQRILLDATCPVLAVKASRED